MKKFRIPALFLAVLMAVTVLSACGNDTPGGTPGSGSGSSSDPYLLDQADGFTEYTFVVNGVAFQLGDTAAKLQAAGWKIDPDSILPSVEYSQKVGTASQEGYQSMWLHHPDYPDVTLLADIDVSNHTADHTMADGFITRLHLFVDAENTGFTWKLGGIVDQSWKLADYSQKLPLAVIGKNSDGEDTVDLYAYCHYENIESAFIDYKGDLATSVYVTFDTTSLQPDPPSGGGGQFTGDYMMRLIFHMTVDGSQVSSEVVVAQRNGELAYQMEYENALVRLVQADGTFYMVDDNQKMAMNMAVIGLDLSAMMPSHVATTSPTGSGTGEVMGKTLPYEEYSENGMVIRYYYDGITPAYITGESQNESFIYEIVEFSTTVPDSLYGIPSDYTIINSMADMIAMAG